MSKKINPPCRRCGHTLTRVTVGTLNIGTVATNWACTKCQVEETPEEALGQRFYAMFPPPSKSIQVPKYEKESLEDWR